MIKLYEGIPMETHERVFVLYWNNIWYTDKQRKKWWPRTWELLNRFGTLAAAEPDSLSKTEKN